ncbi:hypothetical protein [Rhizobium sp. NFACC06-2]|uniref:hypothetical protein n=1 Tax=Rhizobium sp. NFACC06-2 TaxID=1566264 RepID=UPI0008771F98|nr:hypothetical protein [Rhizobium sp. NFACC06-2]SCY92321.1 hypothetical protein SAMN03159288_05265 [Rhizobium sp. NFACC06-2]
MFRTLAQHVFLRWRQGDEYDAADLFGNVRTELLNAHSNNTLRSDEELTLIDAMCRQLDEFEQQALDEGK